MIDEEYKVACTEVLEVMNYVSKEDYNKVPKEVIQTLEKNKKVGLMFLYNPWKDINEQEISEKGRLMLASFFRDYWATDEQKSKIEAFQINKSNQIEEEIRNQYNDAILKNNKITRSASIKENKNISMIECKGNFFDKFANFIKKLFEK